MFLQAQRPVSRQKPWNDTAFRLGLVLCLEMWSIAELDIHFNECMRLNIPNHLLDKLRAVRSPRLFLSMVYPPKTYIRSSTRTAACLARGDGMDPVHCSSLHFRVEMSSDQVSLYKCGSSPPPNLQDIIMRGEGKDERGTNTMIRSPVVTETWPHLGGGLLSPGAGSYDSQRGFDITAEYLVKMAQGSEGQTYNHSNQVTRCH